MSFNLEAPSSKQSYISKVRAQQNTPLFKRNIFAMETTKDVDQQQRINHHKKYYSVEKTQLFQRQVTKIKNEMKSQENICRSYAALHLIAMVDQNDVLERNYLIFLIPLCLILAEVLSTYQDGGQSLFIYKMFTQTLKKIIFLNRQQNKQIDQIQCIDYLTISVNYKFGVEKVRTALRHFLVKYKVKMQTFIPYYYNYFSMISDRQAFVFKDISQVREMIQGVVKDSLLFKNKV